MDHSLEVYHDSRLIFYSDRHWIHPLFEFESFLQQNEIPRHELVVCDKIVGKAAALLLAYFHIRQVKAELISQLGLDTLRTFHITCEYQKKVDKIYCQTEKLLLDENDPAKAYHFLKTRVESLHSDSPQK